MKRFTALSVVVLCALGSTSTAVLGQPAEPAGPEQVAEQATLMRQGLLKVMGWAFTGHVGPMMRHVIPFNATVAQTNAHRVAELADMLPEAFQYDTHKFQVKTKAKENIWTNAADFATKAGNLKTAALALEEAVKGGDQAAALKAAESVGKACGACHDGYREK
jgi:cytochrome c556